MTPLLAWSQDEILAHRSGYQVLADYLPGERLVARRWEAASAWPLLASRLQRRFSFSRWCSTGSFELEQALRKWINDKSVSLLHLLWCDRDLAFLDLDARLGLPLIGTFHQCADELPLLIRRPGSLRHFKAIIIMSESQRRFFLDHGVPPDRLHRVLHGVDVDYFTPSTLDVLEDFMVLAVGGTRRDFPQMRAVAEALEAVSGIRFVFVGPADRAYHFNGLSCVTYLSRIHDGELLALYRQAACFLHLPEAATANNAMLEAMACGAPVVSQLIEGVPEYLTDDSALLSAAGDVEGTVKQVRELAASRTQQQEMRHAARAQARRLDWHSAAEQTTAIYHQVA